MSAKPISCDRCQRDGTVVKRAGGYWCTYCHRTVKPSRKAQGAWVRAEKVAAMKARWRAANKEKVAAMKARWYAANKEKVAANSARWRAANKEKVAAMNAVRLTCSRCSEDFIRPRGRPARQPLCPECKPKKSPRAHRRRRARHYHESAEVAA